MFCPNCGITQDDRLNFCKTCGANLEAIRQAVTKPAANEKFGLDKTWVAEMLMSEKERELRNIKRESLLTPDEKRYKQTVKRYNEIKAGVITSSVGLGVMIFLYIFMRGIILSGDTQPGDAEILSRIWVAGLIPFFVGLGLIFNGLIVSKKLVELHTLELQPKNTAKNLGFNQGDLQPPARLPEMGWLADSSTSPSITEHTTRELEKPVPNKES